MPAASTYSESPSAFEKRSSRTCWGRVWYKFSTQQTPGHPTIFNLAFSTAIFFILAVAYLVGGGIMLTISLRQVQIKATYSDVEPLKQLSDDERARVLQGETVNGVELPIISTIEVEVQENMPAPVYVYLILEDFYQNHKRYVRSVSYGQLHGESVSAGSLEDCRPQRNLPDAVNDPPNDGLINPCGLISWSYANDTISDFQVARTAGEDAFEAIEIDNARLVWDSDRDTFFGNYEAANLNTVPEYRGGGALKRNVAEAEHFMEWMRPAAHPTVRKYLGKLDTDLEEGDRVRFNVDQRFNTYTFHGTKRVMFTTQGSFGNRNLTFGLVWLVMGVLCGIITVTFLLVGWKQLWSARERVAFLKQRWDKGRIGNLHRTPRPASPPLETPR